MSNSNLLQCCSFFFQLITKLQNTLSFFNVTLTAQLFCLQMCTICHYTAVSKNV